MGLDRGRLLPLARGGGLSRGRLVAVLTAQDRVPLGAAGGG